MSYTYYYFKVMSLINNYLLVSHKQQILMYIHSNFGKDMRKTNGKNVSEERSKTPNKQSVNKLGQRESKSLAKRDERPQHHLLGYSLMEPIKEWNQGVRHYYLGRGNNHQAVRRALSQRKNLVQTSNTQGLLFKWTQNASGFKYHRLGKDCMCFNHFQFHRQISNKQRLVWNMINFCQSNKLNAFNYIPTTFTIDLTTGEEDMALHGFLKFYNRNIPEGYVGQKVQSILLPKIKNIPYYSAQQLRKKCQGNFYCKPTCPKTFFGKTNSYLWILKPTYMNRGRGVALFGNLSQFQKLIWQFYQGQGLEDYENKPEIAELYRISEIIEVEEVNRNNENTQMTGSTELEAISPLSPSPAKKDQKHSIQKQVEPSPSPQKSPKVSPSKVENLSQIMPQIKLQSASSQVKAKPEQKANPLRVLSFVVQKYIQCPMLINQRKFDIRVWVLLTHNYEVYFFKEGYIRSSSHKYSSDNHKNPFIHLTNNSVQKHCNEYDEESGNQLTLSDLRQFLQNDDTYNKIQIKIREMIWLSMCSARRKINVNARKECFQLFGYDFMVDDAYKTWLIEVNTNPAIDENSSVLKMLIPRLLDDMFKLTLDRLYNLKLKEAREEYPVRGYSDENMWQLLGDFREGINQKTMGKRLTLVRR